MNIRSKNMSKNDYTYDYTKCMMMKILVAKPDRKGGSIIEHNVEQIFEIIKNIENLTYGITKILYLVGWQYLGHDDKYPDFFDVNEGIKRPQDSSAYDSLIWLFAEAKKYNTIISFHINFNDVYTDAPSFNDFLTQNALIRNKNGKPCVMDRYNGKKCYKTCFKQYWESGLFSRQIEKLLALFPIKEAGTIHIDNFQCYSNYSPYISISEMQSYRDRMIAYFRNIGVDITTEFTCREHNGLRNKTIFGTPREHNPSMPIDILGKIPAVWWLTYLSEQELVDISPQLLSGGLLRNGTKNDFREKFIYGNIHGEDVFQKRALGNGIMQKNFLHDFATIQVPYFFLCNHKRQSISIQKGDEKCVFSEGIVSYLKGQQISYNGNIIKDGDALFLPYLNDNTFFAYSAFDDEREWNIGEKSFTKLKIYEVSADKKPELLCEIVPAGSCIKLKLFSGKALIIVGE